MNVHAAFFKETGKAGVGVVARDVNGVVLLSSGPEFIQLQRC